MDLGGGKLRFFGALLPTLAVTLWAHLRVHVAEPAKYEGWTTAKVCHSTVLAYCMAKVPLPPNDPWPAVPDLQERQLWEMWSTPTPLCQYLLHRATVANPNQPDPIAGCGEGRVPSGPLPPSLVTLVCQYDKCNCRCPTPYLYYI